MYGCGGIRERYGSWGIHAAHTLTVFHSERPKLYTILAFLSAIGLIDGQVNFTVVRKARHC